LRAEWDRHAGALVLSKAMLKAIVAVGAAWTAAAKASLPLTSESLSAAAKRLKAASRISPQCRSIRVLANAMLKAIVAAAAA